MYWALLRNHFSSENYSPVLEYFPGIFVWRYLIVLLLGMIEPDSAVTNPMIGRGKPHKSEGARSIAYCCWVWEDVNTLF